MINRRMSIGFPLQANALQNLNTSQEGVVDYWFHLMQSQFKSKPSWLYTKTAKAKEAKKKSKKDFSEESLYNYSKRIGCELKDFKKAIDFFGDEVTDEIKKFEKIFN